jgi:cytochrome c-type biogenesis protein CcmF
VTLVGELSLWVAILMAAWTTTVSWAGAYQRRPDLVFSGERAMYATFAFTLVASLGLWYALFTHDFSLRFVSSYTSRNLPSVYTFTAFWAGQAGSMLFWTLILAMYGALAVYLNRRNLRQMMPWVTGTLGLITLFFLLTTAFGANPFERLDWVPVDGRGMNPQLQNPGMAIHPPMLYLGYVATAVPFAFAIGALITRQLDGEWLGAVRRWSLLSWFFLTIGIALGMWWAYVELGWSGYWAWDPVENSSALPWFTGTAFLHSIMIQEKRGMLKKWNVTLVVLTFLLSILGTFITRSGVIESVHAFAQSNVGAWFLGFLIAATVLTAILVSTRLKDMEATAELESMVSREAAFLYNNLVLVGIAFATLWGTLFPILSEWVQGEKITVGIPFFNSVNTPLGLLLLALTGIGPLIAWRRASTANLKRQFAMPVAVGVASVVVLLALGMRHFYAIVFYGIAAFVATTITLEFVKGIGARRRMYSEGLFAASTRLVIRNRRRYGGYIVHFGVVVMFAAFAGMFFKKDYTEVELKQGETYAATDPFGDTWTFTSQGMSRYRTLNREATAITLETARNGKPMGFMVAEKRQHFDATGATTFEPSTEVAINEMARQDVYVFFSGLLDAETAVLHIHFNPLVVWVWMGGFIMAFGGIIVMWPQAEQRERGYVAELAPQHDGAMAGAGA